MPDHNTRGQRQCWRQSLTEKDGERTRESRSLKGHQISGDMKPRPRREESATASVYRRLLGGVPAAADRAPNSLLLHKSKP